MSPIMEFRNVNFAHSTRAIFEDLSLSVTESETVALIGPNGVGKTTLLRLAAGLLRPSSGEIRVAGRALSDWNRRELSCCVALVPQYLQVPFAFRVEEIVAQGRVPYSGFFGGLGSDDLEVVRSAMEAVDILHMRHRVFAELSGGERQRVKIAIGLAQQPKLMLLDEPTQHLDLGRQIELMALLKKLVGRGITIVAAVHDLALARENCSSAILLTPGAPAIKGSVKEVLHPELLERAFSVDQPDLERYLAAEPPARNITPGPEQIDESLVSLRKKREQEHRERLRHPGDDARCRGTARDVRHGRGWDRD